MKTAIVLILVVLGFAMYFVGALWPKMFPVATTWTNEKAARVVEVNERLAQLGVLLSKPVSMHSGTDRGVMQRELLDLVRETNRLNAEFEEALKRHQTKPDPLKTAGIAVAAIGVVAWFGMRFREARKSLDPANATDTLKC